MFSFLEKSPSAGLVLEKLKKKSNVFAEPVPAAFKGTFYSYLACGQDKNVIILTSSDEMYRIYSEMSFILKENGIEREILLYPEDDSLIYSRIKASYEISKMRSIVYRKSFESGFNIIITDINALMEKITGPERIRDKIIKFHRGMKIKQDAIASVLAESGYERCLKTEKVFDYSIRGGIVDIFSPDFNYPVRLEFFGDEIESIRFYSQDTYNTTKETDEIVLFLFNPGEKEGKKTSSIMDFFVPAETIFFIDDMDLVKKEVMEKIEKVEKYITESESVKNIYNIRTVLSKMAPYTKLKTYSFEKNKNAVKIRVRLNPPFKRDIDAFYSYAKEETAKKMNIILVSDNEGETEHLKEMIRERSPEGQDARISAFMNGDIEKGYVFPEAKLIVISNREIFQRYKGKVLGRLKQGNLKRIKHTIELEENDLIVHREHGIGIFGGVKSLSFEGISGDFILIKYAGDDKLYIPIHKIDMIDKYIGTEKLPSLSKLGTEFWKRTREDIQKQLEKMAAELLEIYAKRKTAEGICFDITGGEYEAFENAFIFEETPDQAKAIETVKRDMASSKQMDRLVCGDAGFGKTEVAMRAAFIAVKNGYQAVVMTATTLLAQQHFNSFKERMADYPVKIEMLSRLVSAGRKKEILEKASKGGIDIIIGTHALVGPNVKIPNPGVVIIDEEQHFGVKSKEELRKRYPGADLLTLTATPIPRTLYFSLSGIRDISIINTPPPGKRRIETYIVNERLAVVKEIILREILRKGQV
ncbi:MAG TPA: DEAD/DEAH box helicase, partial [Firmicutes bacterium]|nr:DEAD/DEAH box helicase [Bacillota bacterium]